MKITEKGEIIVEWWTPEVATLVCLLKPTKQCKDCKGWIKVTEKNIDCPMSSRYCG